MNDSMFVILGIISLFEGSMVILIVMDSVGNM